MSVDVLNKLKQKMTLFTGIKGEGDAEFTFKDFYLIERLIDTEIGRQNLMLAHASLSESIALLDNELKG